MKAEIKLRTVGGGLNDVRTLKGEIAERENFTILSYLWDGDDCRTEIAGDELFQFRRGKVNLNLVYRRGTKTLCKISGDCGEGAFEVYTEKLNVEKKDGKVFVFLVYESGGEKTEIEIQAEPVIINR